MRSTERLADASRRLTAPSSQGRARLMSITAEGTACGAMRALDLPETEAPHPGVSSGGVEVRVGKKERNASRKRKPPIQRQLGGSGIGMPA